MISQHQNVTQIKKNSKTIQESDTRGRYIRRKHLQNKEQKQRKTCIPHQFKKYEFHPLLARQRKRGTAFGTPCGGGSGFIKGSGLWLEGVAYMKGIDGVKDHGEGQSRVQELGPSLVELPQNGPIGPFPPTKPPSFGSWDLV